jgi:hypothetical protein
MKQDILAAIGEAGLRQPALVNAALAANDRIKYAFALLQMAALHARQPEQEFSNLKRERIAANIDDRSFDDCIGAAHRARGGTQIPGAARVLANIAADLHAMAAPLAQSGDFAARRDRLLAALPGVPDDTLDDSALAALTRTGTAEADSLHQLVMDLHKALNGMQAALAEEQLDGAPAYGLAAEDRPLVTAFMAGLNRTARLKFDHPGLATTATRHAGALVLQNDIGTTDAHVIVIHVTALQVDVTYSDVHEERLAFFQDMLARYQPVWEAS